MTAANRIAKLEERIRDLLSGLAAANKRWTDAEAALAEANKRICESAKAYARLFAEKAFVDKQLASAKQHETALFALAASLGQSTVLSEPPTEFILRQIATARQDERERCERAVDDAGGDNTGYHIAAIQALTNGERRNDTNLA